jgi:hypothetical protein
MVPHGHEALPAPISCARPNARGEFLFYPGRGGPRMDRPGISAELVRRHIEAAHFAEVNTYFHIDRMAHYIHGLLAELRASPLPRVIAVVHAHNACCGREPPDGRRRRGGCRPFQGGHYRLPGEAHDIVEQTPVSASGEIHLGAGQRRLSTGALAWRVGKPYRHNAGHNAGIIYHEYSHHVCRHTADFRSNGQRSSDVQSNRKVSMDEGTCDYWAGVMLGTPHIWAWHRRHDAESVHRRSLASSQTMADYQRGDDADPHINGTIWAAALWEFRTRLETARVDGGRVADLIVLQGLLLIGRIYRAQRPQTNKVRSRFRTGLQKLLEADRLLTGGAWQQVLLDTFNARGIYINKSARVRP